MHPNINLLETTALICNDLEIEPRTFSGSSTYEEIRDRLAFVIERWLVSETERLSAVLYRIDVPEQKVKLAIHQENKSLVPICLADLILEREMQKMHTRKLYREYINQKNNITDNDHQDGIEKW